MTIYCSAIVTAFLRVLAAISSKHTSFALFPSFCESTVWGPHLRTSPFSNMLHFLLSFPTPEACAPSMCVRRCGSSSLLSYLLASNQLSLDKQPPYGRTTHSHQHSPHRRAASPDQHSPHSFFKPFGQLFGDLPQTTTFPIFQEVQDLQTSLGSNSGILLNSTGHVIGVEVPVEIRPSVLFANKGLPIRDDASVCCST
ncbi:hypothetical protein PoB_004113100 [Plakobranchus ocellatus]|uniref:Uncharacterized protein n=1 Tax=Plakobranchus ocellatus TaxID=259542 RepID=A0AAV4B741_9GAST|nr:hypothetical protein PoB_004113100 [Plakobranchus ocellatus]